MAETTDPMAERNALIAQATQALRQLQNEWETEVHVAVAYDPNLRRWYATGEDAHHDWKIRVECESGAVRNTAEDALRKLVDHAAMRIQTSIPIPRQSRSTPRSWKDIPGPVRNAAMKAETLGASLFVRVPTAEKSGFVSVHCRMRGEALMQEAREEMVAAGFDSRPDDLFVWSPAEIKRDALGDA